MSLKQIQYVLVTGKVDNLKKNLEFKMASLHRRNRFNVIMALRVSCKRSSNEFFFNPLLRAFPQHCVHAKVQNRTSKLYFINDKRYRN